MGEDELAVLRRALDLSGTGFMLADPRLPDAPLVYVNRSFLAMTGYTADEVLGRNCRFLQGRDTDPGPIDELRRAIADGRSGDRRAAQLPQGRHAVLERGPHLSRARRARRGRALRRRAGRRHGATVEEQRLRFAAQDAERRSTFLAEASPLLDASLDLRSTLDSLTHLSVPFLGDVVPRLRGPPRRGPAAGGGGHRPGGRARSCASCRAATRSTPATRSRCVRGDRPRGDAPAGDRVGPAAAPPRPTSRGDARAAEGARDASSASSSSRRWTRTAATAPSDLAAGRGPRPPRRARARQRAALREPRRGGAGAAGRRCCRSSCRSSTASSSPPATGPPATAA